MIIAIAAGCSKEAKVANHTQKGDAFYASGDYEKARIEYLNVTRLSPTNAHAFAQIGHIFYENGMALKSAAFYSRAIELGDQSPGVRARRAVLLAMGDRAKGEEEALAALERDPQHEEAMLLLADIAVVNNKIAEVRMKIGELRRTHGDLPVYDTAEAVLELKSRRIEEAEQLLDGVTAAHPDFAPAHLILSSIYLSRSNLVDGEAALKRAAKLSPPRSNRQMLYIDFLLKRDKEAGLAKIDEVLERAPDYVPARLRLAQLALADKDYETVTREVGSIISRDPQNIESRQLQAQMYLATRELDKAQDIMSDLVRMYPGAAQLWYQAALTSIAKNDAGRSLREVEKAYELNPKLPQAMLLRGRLLMAGGRFSDVIESTQRFITESPRYPPAYLQLADAFIRSDQSDEALAVYRDYESKFEKDPRGAHLQGLVLLRQEKSGDAVGAFERALIASPLYFPSIEQLALIDLQAEKFDEAAARVSKYLAENPDSAAGHYLMGRVHLAAENYQEAEKQFEAAIESNPQLENAYFALVQIYSETDRKAEAKIKLESLLREKPTDRKALMTLGIMLTEEKDYQGAADRYEVLLSSDAGFFPALNNLAYIYSEHLSDLDRAYELARKAQQLEPEDPKVGDTLGWILYHRKEYPLALVHLEESAAKLPEVAEVLYHLGMNHYRLGNVSRAAGLLANSLSLAKDDEKWRSDARAGLDVLELDVSNADASVLSRLEELSGERPDDAVVLTRLAQVQEALGNDPAALENYLEAGRLAPSAVDPMIGQARIRLARGELNQALALARKARAASEEPNVALEIGRVAFAAKDHAYAYALLKDAVEPVDAGPDALMVFAEAAVAVGQLGAAEAACERALRLGDGNRTEASLKLRQIGLARARAINVAGAGGVGDGVLGRFIASRLKAAAGSSGEAIAGYQAILNEFPHFSPAMKQLAIELVKNPATIGEAEKWAREARLVMPGDAELSKVLGEAAFAKEDYRYAAEVLNSAARTIGDDPGLFLLLARSQEELKQVAQAKDSIKRASALPLSEDQKKEAAEISDRLSAQ